MTLTRRLSISAARAASLAIVVVLPAPVGPTSITTAPVLAAVSGASWRAGGWRGGGAVPCTAAGAGAGAVGRWGAGRRWLFHIDGLAPAGPAGAAGGSHADLCIVSIS